MSGFTSCLATCWQDDTPADCGYDCLAKLETDQSRCVAEHVEEIEDEIYKCPENSEAYWGRSDDRSCFPRGVNSQYCCCFEGYKANAQNTDCVKCNQNRCDVGETCKTCRDKCACKPEFYEFCDPSKQGADSKGCYSEIPEITVISGPVSLAEGNKEYPVDDLSFIPSTDSVRLYQDPRQMENTVVEITWADGKKIMAVLPAKAKMSGKYEEFKIDRAVETEDDFEWLTDTVTINGKLSKNLKLRMTSPPTRDASSPYRYSLTYRTPADVQLEIKIKSDILLELQPDGSAKLTTLEGSPEIVYPHGSIIVPVGQYSVISADGTPSQPQQFDPSTLDRWWETARDGDGGAGMWILLIVIIIAAVCLIFFLKKRPKAVGIPVKK